MTKGIGTYNGEEIQATFTATGVWSDGGGERMAMRLDWEDVRLESVTILGRTIEWDEIGEFCPGWMQKAIMDLSYEVEFEVTE